MREGKGTFWIANGDQYEGEFRGNMFHGFGKYSWANGDVFEGQFVEGTMGEGKMDYAIGVTGSGMFNQENRKNIIYEINKDKVYGENGLLQ